MTEIIDYGRFAERLRRVMPRWDARERMSAEEFAEHLADTGPRWTLLREFQEEWGYENPGGGPVWARWSEDEHKAYLRRLEAAATGEEADRFEGVDLTLSIPKALDEWWDLPFNSFTHRPRLYWTNPEWPPTVRPGPAPGGAADRPSGDDPFSGLGDERRICVFKAEYQYCNEWGYLAADSALADPKVLVSVDDHSWVTQSRSISEFFLQLAVDRLPAHYGWSVQMNEADPELMERVRRAFPALGLLPWRELGTETVTYGAPDAIIYHDVEDFADFPFVVHARTRAALENVASALGVDWSERIREPEAVLEERAAEAKRPRSPWAGESDPQGRWSVVTASDDPQPGARPSLEPSPGPSAASLVGEDPGERTAWAVDAGRDLAAAGDEGGGLCLWRLDRSGAAATPPVAETPETPVAPDDSDDSDGGTPHDAPITAIACIHLEGCGPTVVSGDAKGLVQLWSPDIEWGPVAIARRSSRTTGISAAELITGPVIAVAWADGVVRLWDVRSGTDVDVPLPSDIETLLLRPDGTLTVGATAGTATVRLHPEVIWPQLELTVSLNRLDWESLRAVHGPAAKVPVWIRDAASDDAGTAESALARLRWALHEEGRIHPATVNAIPFLARLAADPGNRVRPALVSLLSEIAQAALDSTDRDPDPELGESWPDIGLAVMLKCVPTLSPLRGDADSAVREAAAELLAALGEDGGAG
ncbi:hypothetical protein [Actinomadura sp. HBU206391]|uniref:hypothetical protein n=1 Tax=Actinomadura sp. HBU206391 TaxID=2731692 RepID=UPI00164FF050|nr:hypothetical protein [Actinomadura sp. HBU206391]MBC6462454.1 hypothetical protein [Actinomadura sp. HBU206391]